MHHKSRSYDVWFLRYKVQSFLLFWTIFCPLTLLTTQWIKILKKRTPGDIIILCMVPEISSGTDRISCHFGLFFALLPANNPENQNFEKMKKAPGDIIILHMSTINKNYMNDSWDMECNRIFSHFGPFLVLLPLPPPPLTGC